jgi:hypothetical protein
LSRNRASGTTWGRDVSGEGHEKPRRADGRASDNGEMRKKGTKPPRSPIVSIDDQPRFVALVEAFRTDPDLTPIIEALEESRRDQRGRRKFGSNGLKVNGKLFALFTRGTLVVKLPKDRVAALVASRVGKPFDPGHGRLMKGWLTVVSPRASWIDLAREAHAYVRSAKP